MGSAKRRDFAELAKHGALGGGIPHGYEDGVVTGDRPDHTGPRQSVERSTDRARLTGRSPEHHEGVAGGLDADEGLRNPPQVGIVGRPSHHHRAAAAMETAKCYSPEEIQPAFAQAQQWMEEFRVPVVVEIILERVTNISMGTEIDAINEFEDLAISAEDAPTAIGLLD
mgnify:CR=1 FL=1